MSANRELLAAAEAAGARISGKPDGSEPVEVIFTPAAWRAFDAALASRAPAQAPEPMFLVCAGGDGYQTSIVPASGLDDAYLLTQWGTLEDIDPEQRAAALEHFHDPEEWLYMDPLRGGKDRVAVEFSISFEDGWVRVVRLPALAHRATAQAPAQSETLTSFADWLDRKWSSFQSHRKALSYYLDYVVRANPSEPLPAHLVPSDRAAVDDPVAADGDAERVEFYRVFDEATKLTGHKPTAFDVWLMARGVMGTDGRNLTTKAPKCSRCGGTGVVDDGEIDCHEDGTPFKNGSIKCVKDCPVCARAALTTQAPAEPAGMREALVLAVHAMRAPFDGWKGELERKALDAANAALAAPTPVEPAPQRIDNWPQLRDYSLAIRALRAVLAEPHGCPFCHSGKIINPAKSHDDDCGFELARRALAAAITRENSAVVKAVEPGNPANQAESIATFINAHEGRPGSPPCWIERTSADGYSQFKKYQLYPAGAQGGEGSADADRAKGSGQ